MECPEKTRSYMEALEEERCKIQVFRRELPLCLDMVTRAIEMCKQQLSGMTRSKGGTNGQISECSEQNSKEGPVLEEFIPIKRVSSPDNHTDRGDHDDELNSHNYEDDEKKKSSWLKSVQLWNPNPEAIDPREDSPPTPHAERESVLDGKAKRGAFQPSPITEKAAEKSSLSPGKAAAAPLAPAAATSVSTTAEKGGGDAGKREGKLGPRSKKKQRRSWSVDLHRLFVHALQQLGGPHVATPKQIRELMKVEDLTNDEIKSHLQKYRLHAKNSSRPNSGNVQAQPHQFLVVGGIWVPPSQPQYAAPEAAMLPGEAHIAHAPVAAPLPAEAAKTRVIWAAQQKAVGSGSEAFDAHGSSNSTTTTSTSTRTVTVC